MAPLVVVGFLVEVIWTMETCSSVMETFKRHQLKGHFRIMHCGGFWHLGGEASIVRTHQFVNWLLPIGSPLSLRVVKTK